MIRVSKWCKMLEARPQGEQRGSERNLCRPSGQAGPGETKVLEGSLRILYWPRAGLGLGRDFTSSTSTWQPCSGSGSGRAHQPGRSLHRGTYIQHPSIQSTPGDIHVPCCARQVCARRGTALEDITCKFVNGR